MGKKNNIQWFSITINKKLSALLKGESNHLKYSEINNNGNEFLPENVGPSLFNFFSRLLSLPLHLCISTMGGGK